jgi:hypothetical protein
MNHVLSPKSFLKWTVTIFVTVILAGCSGGDNPLIDDLNNSLDNLNRPVANPQLTPVENLPVGEGGVSHNLLGSWTVAIDSETQAVEIVPDRIGLFHFNVVKFIDGPPLNLGVSINGADSDIPNGLVDCMVTLNHPFDSSLLNFCGFDVRGILFTQGSDTLDGYTFAAAGETQLLNADGHTRWWNPVEFTNEGLLGFDPGAAGNKNLAPFTATLNPYKYFSDALDADDPVNELFNVALPNDVKRGIFKSGESNTRRYRIQFPAGPQIIFQYGVDASWVAPTVKPPTNLPFDFPIEANSPEPFLVEVDQTVNTLWYNSDSDRGGELFLNIRVSDWQGKLNDDIQGESTAIYVTCPGAFAGPWTGEFVWEDANYAHYIVDVGDFGIPAGSGTYPCLIEVASATGSYDQGFPVPFPSGPVIAYRLVYIDIPSASTPPFALPYVDDMGENTVPFWTVENGAGHAPPLGTEWAHNGDHWGVTETLGDDAEPLMDTYLVTPQLVVPDSGELTIRYVRYMDVSSAGTAGGQVMYRINGGSWMEVSDFFSEVWDLDGSTKIPGQGQNPSLTGLTPGDNIEIGFHFMADGSVPSGPGYHIYRVVVQEYAAPDVTKIEYPIFVANSGLGPITFTIHPGNTSPFPNHTTWAGYNYSDESTFLIEENAPNTYGVSFPSEGKFWVGANVYVHTPCEFLVGGVGSDIDVYSYAPTPGAFFTDDFTDTSGGWDTTTGGDYWQIRGDGSGALDNRKGETGCYGEDPNDTFTAQAEKVAMTNIVIPGAAMDGNKTYMRMFHRHFLFPFDTGIVRVDGTNIFTGDKYHYQSYNYFSSERAWSWFDSFAAPNLEVQESVFCLGDNYNGTSISLELVSIPSNVTDNCYTDAVTYGWQVDYVELYQVTDLDTVFFDDFNRSKQFDEESTYNIDNSVGADSGGNFWRVVPDMEGGYLTNVQDGTGCWNGTTALDLSNKESRVFCFVPHTANPLEITVRHRFNVENEGEFLKFLVNGTPVNPDSGFIYNGSGDYWTGSSGGWVETHWTGPVHPSPGKVEQFSFLSESVDEFDNCLGTGYEGWQIDWIRIDN